MSNQALNSHLPLLQRPLVFHFDCPLEFLINYKDYLESNFDNFSLRRWAQKMELKSHSSLLKILSSKAQIKIDHLSFLTKGLDLNTDEKTYYQFLVQKDLAQTESEKSFYKHLLHNIKKSSLDFSKTNYTNENHIFSSWLNMAILSSTYVIGDKFDVNNIYEFLKSKLERMDLNIDDVQRSMKFLFKLELLKKDEKGHWTTDLDNLSSLNDVPSTVIQEYHREMLRLANISLTDDPVEHREFQAFMISFSPSHMNVAKDMIRNFRFKFCEKMEELNKKEENKNVYQFNLQFFPLGSCNE